MSELILTPHGFQNDVLESPAREILCGGQAGPGKTWLLLFMDIEDAMKHPNLRIMIIRRTYSDMNDLIFKAREMYTPLGAKFFSHHPYLKRPCFQWPEYDEDGNIVGPDGAFTMFGYLAKYGDVERYQGLELHRVRFDELTQFAEAEYLYLFSRIRSCFDPRTGEAIPTNVVSSCNPTGKGMLWVKRRFVDPMPPLSIKSYYFNQDTGKEVEVPLDHPLGIWRQFVPGVRADNIHLNSAEYEASLSVLRGRDYHALAEGSWEIETGPRQLFHPAWIDRALSGNVTHEEAEWDWIGADVAHGGGDKAVIVRGNGNRVLLINSWKGMTNDFSPLVYKEATLYDVPCGVAIDSNGIGAGEANALEFGGVINIQEGNVGGLPPGPFEMRPLPHLERCILKDDMYDITYRGSVKFKSFKAQAYHKLAQDLRQGKIDLSALNEGYDDERLRGRFGGEVFADVDELYTEMMAIEYDDDQGFFQVTDKKRLRKADSLGRSPDFLDGLVYWNFFRERPVATKVETQIAKEKKFVKAINALSPVEEIDPYGGSLVF